MMMNCEFNANINRQMEICNETLIGKGKEYASDFDRLHNFRTAAALQGITMRQALAGMMAKHTTSVYDMCASDEEFTREKWDEKITDHINYLLILQAVLYDERSKSADQQRLDFDAGYIHDYESLEQAITPTMAPPTDDKH